MKRNIQFLVVISILISEAAFAQTAVKKEVFTHADTLRGSLNAHRTWWDVLRYDLSVQPDFKTKTIEGKTVITFKTVYNVVSLPHDKLDDYFKMQIDLQQPLIIDSIKKDIEVVKYNSKTKNYVHEKYVSKRLQFERTGNIALVQLEWEYRLKEQGTKDSITIYYHGKPREAVTPPWDGGWIWKNDAQGRPWMSVACQGLGASVWYPCKDHQSDEPDDGATLTMIVPDSLVAIANGRLTHKITADGLATYTWQVKNPINNYLIIPSIGKYVNFTDTVKGEKGRLDMSYWVLDYNLDKAKEQFKQAKLMMHAFEYWFGPYPFYEDSYKLVESPHLGMEHQSATAYGNKFANGYLGRDLSGTGWGLKWDYIIIHESGHEWFANNITTNDIADEWVHEGITDYSETLFTEYYYGIEAGNDYNFGQRRSIFNREPIIGPYGVNKEGSGDRYPKGANLMHTIRHSINNDVLFRQILRGLNKTFYHQTVTSEQVEDFISQQAGFNYKKVFDQYLRNISIPVLEYYKDSAASTISYRYTNTIAGFNLPIVINPSSKKIMVTTDWQTGSFSADEWNSWNTKNIERLYYIKTKQLTSKP
jgi:aminopeptidase N